MTMMLDTRVVSPGERSAYWAAGIAEHYFPVRVDSFAAGLFDARLTGAQVGPLVVRSISGLPHRVSRTPRMVADADPESILLYLVRRGACLLEQDGRICELRAGDVAVHDTSRPSSFEARVGFDVTVVSFPRWFLGGYADAIADRVATRVRSVDDPLARLAAPLFVGVERVTEGAGLAGSDGDAAAEMLLPVIRNLFRDRDGDDDHTTGADLLHARMRRYALESLQDPALDPEQIARAHHVSVRYVHKLFAPSGGVAAWIREQRMKAAADELRTTALPVADVAVRWGYRDAASFARAFRRAWGQSPGQLRRASA